MQKKLNSDSD